MLRPEITKNAKRTLSQLVREFWLQFIIGICWALYRVKIADGELISVFIANFSVSFFLASWLWGQVIRVRRQQRVEDEFQHVKSELQKLLGSLEKQTQHLIGHTTGGDSVGYFSPTFFSKDQLDFMFLNVSQYPVFDVFAEWIDLDEKTDFENKKNLDTKSDKPGDSAPKQGDSGCVRV